MNDWPTRAEIVAEAHTDVVNDTARPCVHEWRLIKERFEKDWGTGARKVVARRWFCVHCRTVEETAA